MANCIPEHLPNANEAEKAVWEQLRQDLTDRDTIIANVRFEHKHQEHEIDFVVVRPGKGITVVEVKGGHITKDANGQLFSHDKFGTAHPIDPAEQTIRNYHALSEYIQPRWSNSFAPRLSWVVVFPDSDLPVDFETPALVRERIIDRGALPILESVIGRMAGLVDGGRHSNDECDMFVTALLGRRDPIRAWAQDADRREEQVERWTADQYRIIKNAKAMPGFRVEGPAGSGKTFVAIEHARRLAADGKRVALLCYTRGLSTYLRAVTDKWPGNAKAAFVGNFHQLGSAWGVGRPANAPDDWWDEGCATDMLAKLQSDKRGDIERFDAIVVDEAQDFHDSWWDVVYNCVRIEDEAPRIALFGASDQQVFGRGGYEKLGLPVLTLSENLRCTKPIAEFASLLTDNAPEIVGLDGPPVRFVQCDSDSRTVNGVASDVAMALLDEGWELEDIVLLKTQHRHDAQREFFPKLANPADASGQQDKYWRSYWEKDDLFYGTVGGFKGLERRVAVVGVDGFREGDSARNVLYVAATRARDLLIVVGDVNQIRAAAGDRVAELLLANRMDLPQD